MFDVFEDVGEVIKKISQVLFYIGIVIGAIVMLWGGVRFLGSIDKYTTFGEAMTCTLEDAIRWDSLYEDAYYGRMQVKSGFGIVVSAFSMLPLYALGEVIVLLKEIAYTNKEIRRHQEEQSEKKK